LNKRAIGFCFLGSRLFRFTRLSIWHSLIYEERMFDEVYENDGTMSVERRGVEGDIE